MKNQLTASERRGILVVAAIALVITAAGWIVSLCSRPAAENPMPEVEVMVHGDSVSMKDSVKNVKNTTKRKRKFRRRSPLDEKV